MTQMTSTQHTSTPAHQPPLLCVMRWFLVTCAFTRVTCLLMSLQVLCLRALLSWWVRRQDTSMFVGSGRTVLGSLLEAMTFITIHTAMIALIQKLDGLLIFCTWARWPPTGKARSGACGPSLCCEDGILWHEQADFESGRRSRGGSSFPGCFTALAHGIPSAPRTLTPWRTRTWRLSGPCFQIINATVHSANTVVTTWSEISAQRLYHASALEAPSNFQA